MDAVEFYWLDDTMEEIILKSDSTVEIHWRDGEVSTQPLSISHEQLAPGHSAARYNAFLEKVRSGRTKVKSKFLMGL